MLICICLFIELIISLNYEITLLLFLLVSFLVLMCVLVFFFYFFFFFFFFFSSRRRHTRCGRDWSSDVCSSDLSFLYLLTQSLEFAAIKLFLFFHKFSTYTFGVESVTSSFTQQLLIVSL